MRRGFKAQAEQLAIKQREEFGITVQDRLSPREFLLTKGIIVWTPEEVPNIDSNSLFQLTQKDPNSWSGLTVKEGKHIAVIVNSSHSIARQANTLIHEWAHIELRHKPSRADRSDGGILLLSDYPAETEEEADWLSACMLTPRDGLLYHCKAGMSAAQVADHYGVSKDLAKWRIGKTGINRQLSYGRR